LKTGSQRPGRWNRGIAESREAGREATSSLARFERGKTRKNNDSEGRRDWVKDGRESQSQEVFMTSI
jgi:hypothetical protein